MAQSTTSPAQTTNDAPLSFLAGTAAEDSLSKGVGHAGNISVGRQNLNVATTKTPVGHSGTAPSVSSQSRTVDTNQQLPSTTNATMKNHSVQRNKYSQIEWPTGNAKIAAGYVTCMAAGALIVGGLTFGLGTALGAGIGFGIAAVLHGTVRGASKLAGPSDLRQMADNAVAKHIKHPNEFQHLGRSERAGHQAAFLHCRDALQNAANEWICEQAEPPTPRRIQQYIDTCAKQLQSRITWKNLAGHPKHSQALVERLQVLATKSPRLEMAEQVVAEIRPRDANGRGDQLATRALAHVLNNATESWTADQNPPATPEQVKLQMRIYAQNLQKYGPRWSTLAGLKAFPAGIMQNLENIAVTGYQPPDGVWAADQRIVPPGHSVDLYDGRSTDVEDSPPPAGGVKRETIYPDRDNGSAGGSGLSSRRHSSDDSSSTISKLGSALGTDYFQQIRDVKAIESHLLQMPTREHPQFKQAQNFVKTFNQEYVNFNKLISGQLDDDWEVRTAAEKEGISLTEGSGERRYVEQQTEKLLINNQCIRGEFPTRFAVDGADKQQLDGEAYRASRQVIKGLAEQRQLIEDIGSQKECNQAAAASRELASESAVSLERNLLDYHGSSENVMKDVCNFIKRVQTYTFLKCNAEGKPYTTEAVDKNMEEILADQNSRLPEHEVAALKQKLNAAYSRAMQETGVQDTTGDHIDFHLATTGSLGQVLLVTASDLEETIGQVGDSKAYRRIADCLQSKLVSVGGPSVRDALLQFHEVAEDEKDLVAPHFIGPDLMEIQTQDAAFAYAAAAPE